MQNLLSNAHRYGGGTPVEVNVRAGTPGNVVFTVSDRGPGIPEAETRTNLRALLPCKGRLRLV